MIAADSSSLIAFFDGENGADVDLVARALEDKLVFLPPVVLTEILSQPGLPSSFIDDITRLPLLEVTAGFWSRAGLLRAKVLAKGFKARIADALIAQGCLDHQCALVTRDSDFFHFEKIGGLRLA